MILSQLLNELKFDRNQQTVIIRKPLEPRPCGKLPVKFDLSTKRYCDKILLIRIEISEVVIERDSAYWNNIMGVPNDPGVQHETLSLFYFINPAQTRKRLYFPIIYNNYYIIVVFYSCKYDIFCFTIGYYYTHRTCTLPFIRKVKAIKTFDCDWYR